MLRQLKISYWLNNLWHKDKLLCNENLYAKYGLKKSTISSISSKDFKVPAVEKPWMDETDFDNNILEQNPTFNLFDANIKQNIKEWHNNGYMKLEEFYSSQDVALINQTIEEGIKSKKVQWRYGQKIFNAIHQFEAIKKITIKEKLTDLLSFTLGKKVQLFQSLNFIHGSKQLAHSDTIHMTTYPLGYLIAVWIALEDISADSGPLTYFPSSHKLPYVLSNDYKHNSNHFALDKNSYEKYENAIAAIIETNKLQKQQFLAKKGDVFIWHANLLHGGSPINNPGLTRKSMVLHFYTEDVICYHEITERPAIFNDKEAHCPPTIS
jgi:ectoine hydroxylase